MATRRVELNNDPGEQDQDPTPEPVTPVTPETEEFVSKKDLEAVVLEIKNSFTEVIETMAALETSKSPVDTPAESREKVGKQLADAKRVNQRAKVEIETEESLGADFLFKGLTDATPKDVGLEIINKTYSAPTESEVISDWQHHLTRVKVLSECLKVKPQDLAYWKTYEAFLEQSGIGAKIQAVAGAPTNYVPTGWSTDLTHAFYQELEVAMIFPEFTMPQNPFDHKVVGRAKAVLRPETTAANAVRGTGDPTYADPPRGNVRYEAKVLMVPILITEEFNEDMLTGYMDELVSVEIPGAMAQGYESWIINGDGDGTHQDSGVLAGDVESASDGLRKMALERASTVALGTYNFGAFSKMVRKGGIYTVKPRDGAWIMSNPAYTHALDFDQVKTLDKYNMPTNTTGVMNMILGRPVYVSGEMPMNLDDTGVVSGTAADDVKTGILHVNRNQFRRGTVRAERVTMEFDNRLQSWVIIATCRKAFNTRENRRAGYTPVVFGINITSA